MKTVLRICCLLLVSATTHAMLQFYPPTPTSGQVGRGMYSLGGAIEFVPRATPHEYQVMPEAIEKRLWQLPPSRYIEEVAQQPGSSDLVAGQAWGHYKPPWSSEVTNASELPVVQAPVA